MTRERLTIGPALARAIDELPVLRLGDADIREELFVEGEDVLAWAVEDGDVVVQERAANGLWETVEVYERSER